MCVCSCVHVSVHICIFERGTQHILLTYKEPPASLLCQSPVLKINYTLSSAPLSTLQ